MIRVQVLNADQLAAQIGRDLGRHLATALEHLGQETADNAQERISVPVTRLGGIEIRSQPGEYPRKDTGKLHEGIQSTVTPNADGCTMLVMSERDGTTNVPMALFQMDRRSWMYDTGQWLERDMPNILVKYLAAAAT